MFKMLVNDRLASWKKLRNAIDDMDLTNAISLTNTAWEKCPFTPFYLDPEKPKEWPDPWQLIIENYYCDLAKCLGIIYTLHLTRHKDQLFPELRTYFEPTTRHCYHIAYLCHGKYVLNLIEGEVVNKEHINQQLKLKRCYTTADLKLEQY